MRFIDGWYLLPGDGTPGDPGRRIGLHEAGRFYWWVAVIDGKPFNMMGGSPNQDPNRKIEPEKFADPDYISKIEKKWGVSVESLLTPEPEEISWKSTLGFTLAGLAGAGLFSRAKKRLSRPSLRVNVEQHEALKSKL